MKLSTIASVFGLAAFAKASYINYTTVTGYFLQDEASTNATTFVYVGRTPKHKDISNTSH